MLSSNGRWSENEFKRLPTTVFSQNWEHIGHHCNSNNKKLDRDLLHDITSFKIDL